MMCLLHDCPEEAMPGEELCPGHEAHYGRKDGQVDVCQWCGARLYSAYALVRGYCQACRERTPAERVEKLAGKRARDERRRVHAEQMRARKVERKALREACR